MGNLSSTEQYFLDNYNSELIKTGVLPLPKIVVSKINSEVLFITTPYNAYVIKHDVVKVGASKSISDLTNYNDYQGLIPTEWLGILWEHADIDKVKHFVPEKEFMLSRTTRIEK